uniref:Uncharacterized protein n=1 Tax=Romanomermis culicivorax TaxID=13658 RepID=A0A915HNU6_ROMCU
MAVVGGLSHSSLARLTKTFICLSPQIKQDFNEFKALLAANNNFNEYRKALSQGKGFKIPIIGVHLKDLISLHSASNDSTSEGLINCRKLAQLASIFTHLLMDIQRPHSFPDPNTDLIHTLKSSLSRPVVFADWAIGVGNDVDPQLVKKHVSAMVEGEFDSIAGNFPFIDSFNVIDSDSDGRISRTDLLQYFIRLNRTIKVDCRHCFKETTFLAPSFCYHCKKMLWGILRQGMKCQNCGLPVHRSCKDHVITDCSIKRRQLLNGSLTAGKSPLAPPPISARCDVDPSPSGDSCSSSRSQQQHESLLSPDTQRRRKLWPDII